jgi:hypothetical protein
VVGNVRSVRTSRTIRTLPSRDLQLDELGDHVFGGRLGSDLIIDGEILRLGPYAPSDAARAIYSPIRLTVDFDDDGQVVLREDRVYGVAGPRCGDPVIFCIPVLVLRPAEQ